MGYVIEGLSSEDEGRDWRTTVVVNGAGQQAEVGFRIDRDELVVEVDVKPYQVLRGTPRGACRLVYLDGLGL